MNSNLSFIIAALLALALSSPVIGFASVSCSRSSVQDFRSIRQEAVVSKQTCVFNSYEQQMPAVSRKLSIHKMASDDEESETAEPEPATADNSDNLTPSEATAGGGTIAITSAKSAADAATPSPPDTPSSKGFSLILLPTLLFKFSIVLIVKFATDVVVYPTLYVWRWARVGKKKMKKGVAKLLGKEVEEKVNGSTTIVNDGEFLLLLLNFYHYLIGKNN